MSTYTKITPELSNNIYFLNDKNIVLDIDENISENAVPSQKLFKEKYDELSTYDSNLCTYVSVLNEKTNTLSCNLSGEIDSLSAKLSADLSTEIENRISVVGKLSTDLSGEIDSLSAKLSADLSTEIENRISVVENLSTSLSNTADEKFVLKSGDLMETLSVAGKTELSGDIVVPNHNVKIIIGNAVAPREGMFIWNGKEDQYEGKEIDDGEGNTFSINPSHELCGVFVGEKSLCAYITEDVALTATEIRGEISTVSSLLTGNYALSSDVSAVSKLVNDKGYLISNDFDFKYDSENKAIWLNAGNKSISVDATNFIIDGMLNNAEISTGTIAGDSTISTYYLVLTFNTYVEGELSTTKQYIDLKQLIDTYEASKDGIKLEGNTFTLDFNVVGKKFDVDQLSAQTKEISSKVDTNIEKAIDIENHTSKLQSYVDELSGVSGKIPTFEKNINELSSKHIEDTETLYEQIKNNATFAGIINITKDMTNDPKYNTIAALLKESNATVFRQLKNGDIYLVNMTTGFDENTFDYSKRYFDTVDDPKIRLSHKDFIVIYKELTDSAQITEENVHKYIKVIPSVRFYELYDLSVTISSDYVWLSGGNNIKNKHAISGDNYFLGRNDIEDLSVKTLSADWKNVKHSDNGYSLYDLSVALSNKIYIDNRVDKDINGTSDLSIVKISKEDYDNTVALETTPLSANVLYIVDSNYIDAYGQVIRNLTMDEDLTASEATNKHYVDSLCASLSDTIVLSVENLQNQIITETARAKGVEEALKTNINTKADNDKLSSYILKTDIINALNGITTQSELSTIRDALISLKNALTSN